MPRISIPRKYGEGTYGQWNYGGKGSGTVFCIFPLARTHLKLYPSAECYG